MTGPANCHKISRDEKNSAPLFEYREASVLTHNILPHAPNSDKDHKTNDFVQNTVATLDCRTQEIAFSSGLNWSGLAM